ncbi:DUF167 domain-containing protein [Candidatus Saccharibacteria bacterium oral taxon 488]|jgi:UPF0235 protein LA_1736|nr:DUF167 domain-containing protein [Candidatus Saccharibacteria bacterium oral taxon 488]
MKISILLKPNSRHREEVVVGDDGVLTIYTKAPAIEGRANLAAVKLLAKYFSVAPSKVKLVRGAASKYKVFEVDVLKRDS